jgi:signal transduction histidine kinase
MARRVAHEMKNPLTPLRLAVHRIGATVADERLREPLAVLDEETGRLEELARQFAVLGRPSSGPRSDVDLAELLRELLATDVPPGIGTELRADAGIPLFHGHYDALQRAFRNLVRNAVEAIASRRAAEPTLVGRILADVSRAGGDIVVRVRDNGCGIPAGSVQRIFEPDFTLKAGGTGLGLAVVRQAVLAHDGRVSASASPDGGAELEVRLPLRLAPNLRHEQSADTVTATTPETAGRTATEEGSALA